MRNQTEYRKHLKPRCEACGFKPIVKSQLHIHHYDWDAENNHPDNLRTVCANCHAIYHSNPDLIDESLSEKNMWIKTFLIAHKRFRKTKASWCYEI